MEDEGDQYVGWNIIERGMPLQVGLFKKRNFVQLFWKFLSFLIIPEFEKQQKAEDDTFALDLALFFNKIIHF